MTPLLAAYRRPGPARRLPRVPPRRGRGDRLRLLLLAHPAEEVAARGRGAAGLARRAAREARAEKRSRRTDRGSMSSRAWTVWGFVAALVLTPVIVSVAYAFMRPQLGIRPSAWIEDHLVLPLFRTRCGGGNEVSAIATLRNVSSSQAQFERRSRRPRSRRHRRVRVVPRTLGRGDRPGNLRAPGSAVLSGVFRTLDAAGEVSRAGYFFRLWLPGADGSWIGESAGGSPSPLLDVESAEGRCRCLAWPRPTTCRACARSSSTKRRHLRHGGRALLGNRQRSRARSGDGTPIADRADVHRRGRKRLDAVN